MNIHCLAHLVNRFQSRRRHIMLLCAAKSGPENNFNLHRLTSFEIQLPKFVVSLVEEDILVIDVYVHGWPVIGCAHTGAVNLTLD